MSIRKPARRSASLHVVNFHDRVAGRAVSAPHDGSIISGRESGDERAFHPRRRRESNGIELYGLEGIFLPVVIELKQSALAIPQLQGRIVQRHDTWRIPEHGRA